MEMSKLCRLLKFTVGSVCSWPSAQTAQMGAGRKSPKGNVCMHFTYNSHKLGNRDGIGLNPERFRLNQINENTQIQVKTDHNKLSGYNQCETHISVCAGFLDRWQRIMSYDYLNKLWTIHQVRWLRTTVTRGILLVVREQFSKWYKLKTIQTFHFRYQFQVVQRL